ncbi:MAG: FAD-binding oxidoreductase [Alphaproteobacteria bacterium]|nr:FAD-binding oxidoreductase [Alphaproteobacteria bacterium]MCW5740236.1 FAD-binding oxidoreductase [Alphaproteobacteria bacterium]
MRTAGCTRCSSLARRIVICGGGAIGAAIAYYAAKRGARPVVIERHEVGGCASGKSGAFLALDWCRGSDLDPLARRSFGLHADLAAELGNPWSYQRLATYAGHAAADGVARGPGRRPWLSGKVTLTQQIGSSQTTATAEPRAFTTGLMRAAQGHGAELRQAVVAGLAHDGKGAVAGVTLGSGEVVEGDAVVIAMGPWSILASLWLRLPAVYAYKGHSIVFESGHHIAPEALFLEYREASGEILSPELFVRADGTTWVCAISSAGSLPVDPAEVTADRDAHMRLEAMCRDIAPDLAAMPIRARQACFRPVTEDGLPLIGAVPDADGVYVATGHSVWGMLNAPATGEAMAELILDGAARHVDLSPFAPGRLRPLDPARLRGA